MAAVNLTSTQTLPSLRLSSSYSPQFTPTLSFNFHTKPSVTLRSISLKPCGTDKPRSWSVPLAVKNLGETELVAVPLEIEDFARVLPAGAGVYAIYDKNDELQFIGLSRNIAASVSTHRKSVPELCGSVKVRFYVF